MCSLGVSLPHRIYWHCSIFCLSAGPLLGHSLSSLAETYIRILLCSLGLLDGLRLCRFSALIGSSAPMQVVSEVPTRWFDTSFLQETGSPFDLAIDGEGFFNTLLTGPGRVWLQTMPVPNVAQALLPYIPTGNG